ncbi:acetyl-CoA decarbonylase/synthase complex subunit gamma [Candidatus Bathyarchaeota archaeon]|nr:MAG: acetyl-CoA decarbonylase/synthase complex subunit gamma [Candidatus Bathyarchaeota archaeon]
MPKKKLGPMDIYPLLPKTNCGRCPQKVCMGFAVQLAERNVSLEECPPLFEDPKYKENLAKLQELLAPPIREVVIGTPKRRVKIGGELVLRRHELRYLNPTAFAIVVDDEMAEDELVKKVKETENFKYTYIGMDLKLDMVAVRSKSNDPSKFEKAVKKVAETTDMPLVLWSFDPSTMEKGLEVVKDRKPLLYAATKDNWQDMGELSLKYKCPLTVYSPNDLNMLKSIVTALKTWGIEDLTIDVGCDFSEGIRDTINNLTMLRIAGIEGTDEVLGLPIVGTPVTLWDKEHEVKNPEIVRWKEACLAAMMIVRYVDLLMLSSTTMWSILPLVIIRNNIYNDPRKPVSVEPGLRVLGNPDPENSPVLITTNFALTYYTVLSDFEKIPNGCYLLVVDTEGISVESSVAGRKFTADKVAEVIQSSKIEEKIKHRTMIIPGLAARLKGDIEDATKWDVLVGPRDSTGIIAFLKENWEGKDHTPGWSYRT